MMMMMAMAGTLLSLPCTTAAFVESARPIITGNCERGNAAAGGALLVNRCAARIASEQRAVSSSCCGLQSSSSVSGSIRNDRCGWRDSLHSLGLEEFRIGLRTRVQSPRKLVRKSARIAAQSFDPKNFDPKKVDVNNVIATLAKLGKQGLEAGTKLVPDTVPRPVAQLGVGLAGLFLGSFVIRSLFSTAFFILAVGGLAYIAFLFLTKGEGGSSSGSSFDRNTGKPKSTDEALEEARRIMDKYK